MSDFEVTIVGAGVVGLAIAARLAEHHPRLLVLEKNEKYGMETSSRNSEVIHAGIYHSPESLRARLCVEGREMLYDVCARHGIAHKRLTKIIVATEEAEVAKLETIYANGLKNGVELQMLDKKQTLELEPHVRAVASIFSPSSGIISAHELMDHFYSEACAKGATVQHRCALSGIEKAADGYRLTVEEAGTKSTITSEIVINAAGLGSDRVAALAGMDVDKEGYRLVLAKGSYFSVPASKAQLLHRLVYPLPTRTSLGIHALLDLSGRLKFGPDVEYLANRTFDYSVAESKRTSFGQAIRRYFPGISDEELMPEMSGVRPKLQREGEPVKDFLIKHESEKGLEGFVNLIGIESPGLTASPAIAKYVEGLLF